MYPHVAASVEEAAVNFGVKELKAKLVTCLSHPQDSQPPGWARGCRQGSLAVSVFQHLDHSYDNSALSVPTDVLSTHLEKVRETFSE